jgi:hypothetical protein
MVIAAAAAALVPKILFLKLCYSLSFVYNFIKFGSW